ncbi:MAG: hypothetical protein FWG98_06685 [Candidatus Cloacimonetes bacterium]|nr:hypothetical protein [Candidatus Cloacimonadota bacterium]
MFRVEFVHSLEDSHSFSLCDGLDDIRFSAEKLYGSDYYSQEPRRLEFSLFINSWLNEHFMSGNYEMERMISEFRCLFYDGEYLLFSGVLDMNHLIYDERGERLSFVAYDNLKLLSIYGDLVLERLHNGHLQDNRGWGSSTFLYWYIDLINQRLQLQKFNTLEYCTTEQEIIHADVQTEELEIYRINRSEIDNRILPAPYHEDNFWKQSYRHERFASCRRLAFSENGGYVSLRITVGVYYQIANLDDVNFGKWKATVWSKRILFMNKICVHEDKDTVTESEIYNKSDDVKDEFNELLGYDHLAPPNVSHIMTSENDLYRCQTIRVFGLDYIIVNFSGNSTPSFIQPDWMRFYSGSDFFFTTDSPLELFKVVKATLLLHNLTITCDHLGVLYLKNKNDFSYSEVISINLDDVIEAKIQRRNRDQLEVSILDVMAGETRVLEKVLIEHYKKYLSSLWILNLTLIETTENRRLKLFDNIEFNGSIYKIASIRADLLNQIIEIEAWKQYKEGEI